LIEDKQITEGAVNLRIMQENMSVLSHVSLDILKHHDEIVKYHLELGLNVSKLTTVCQLGVIEAKLKAIEKNI
jgi:hypothetical protein